VSYALSIQPQTHTRAGSQPEDRIVNQAVHRVEVRAERSVESQVGDDSLRITGAIAHGDSSAFGLFYDAWFPFAFNEARRYTQRDEATCLDIVQDAMLKAARSMRPLQSKADIERWLTRVVQTSALDTLRQEQRRRQREYDSADRDRHGSSAAQRAAQDHARHQWLADQIEWLMQEVATISTSDQVLLHLRYALGRSLEQTGRAVGISADAAHGRLRRIIARLRGRAEDAS